MTRDSDGSSSFGVPGEEDAATELDELGERYRILVQQNLVGIALVQDGEFVHVNPRLAEIHGYEPAELLDVDPIELLPEGRRDEVVAEASKLLDGELEETTVSGPVRRKDGGTAHVEAYLERTEYRGEDAFLSVTVDVTDRVRQAATLEMERERLDFLNAMLRHHVLNGMNVVLATAERLAADADGERGERLETIRRRGTAIVDLVGTSRSLIRTIQRDAGAGFSPVDLEATLRRSAEAAEAAHGGATVTLAGFDADLRVYADGMLDALFDDLLENAIVHDDADEPAVRVRVEPDDDVVSIHVEDEGPGVPEAVREDVFEGGLTGERSGFGLHVVHLLVTLYGGTLEIDDREPRGTVVTVTLPRAPDGDG